jgi:hypothetical protein
MNQSHSSSAAVMNTSGGSQLLVEATIKAANCNAEELDLSKA